MDYSTIERRSVINGSKLGNLRRQGAGEPPPAASWGTSAGSVMGDFPFMLR